MRRHLLIGALAVASGGLVGCGGGDDDGVDRAADAGGFVVTGPGGQRQVVFDLIGVRVGRVEVSIGVSALGGPFDPALSDHLLRLSIDRLAAASSQPSEGAVS
jgi:hypothetical protein